MAPAQTSASPSYSGKWYPQKSWKVTQQETQQQVRYHKNLIVNDTVLEKSPKSLSSFHLMTHKQRERSTHRKWENTKREKKQELLL